MSKERRRRRDRQRRATHEAHQRRLRETLGCDRDDSAALPSPNPDRLRPVHQTAAYVAARQAREDARARPRSSSGITLVEADTQPPASSSADASPFDPVDDGPPMPFEPLDVFDDDEGAARAEAEPLELETLRRDSYCL